MSTVFTAGKIKPAVQGGKVADTTDLDRAFVKAISDDGSQAIQQNADGNEETRDLVAGLSNADRHDLNVVPGLEAKTADLEVEATERTWGDVEDLDEGGYVSNSSGSLDSAQAAALDYVLSGVPTQAEAGHGYVYIKIPAARSSRDYRIRQHGNLGTFFIASWDHIGSHETFNYYRSRHNLFAGYGVSIQYDALTAGQTHFRGKSDAANVGVASDGFDGRLAATDDTVQKVAQKLDDLPEVTPAQAKDAESDVQGTVSGRRMAESVAANESFTDVEQDILGDLSRITYPHPTDDWQIRQTYSARDFFESPYSTFLSLGWDADNRLRALSGDGHVGRLGRHNRGRIYDGSERLRAGLISGVHWLFLRDNTVHGGSDIERAPVDGGDSSVTFEINSIRYFSMFADPDSGTLIGILRRINATDMEVGLLAYDSAAGTVTAEDTITLDLAHINNALGADFATLTNIHHESASGTYQGVSGAILEGDTLYVLLTDITKADGHTASVLVGYTLAGTPNNRTLTILAENAVDELPVSDELVSGILPLEADELFLARDTAVYRLSGPEAGIVATDDTITGDGTEAAPIGVVSPYPGPATWPTLGGRPTRPNAVAIIIGNSTAESTPSVSDVVAIANAHSQRTLANADPEPVAVAAAEGTDGTVSRRDHVHALPVDSTLEFDPVSGDLGVNVHDVIQHLQENIRYYTDSIDHPADPGGHSAGQMYRTGPFPTTISRVQAQIDVLFGHPSYAARIYRVDSNRRIEAFLGESNHFVPLSNNPHSYDFTGDDGIGIPIPTDSHIVILFHAVGGVLIPLRSGGEASASPGKSYQDANRDFDMIHSVVYEHVHPSVGDGSVDAGDSNHIRGNIKIFYDIAYDHGSLLGDSKANTDLQNVDEDLTDDEKLAVRIRIGAAAGNQQQQASGTRVLADRTIISGGTLLAANAFNFDLASDGAIVVAGLGFAAVPLDDIFDFVATIRIGGRAGNQIQLSREQFDYVGEPGETVFGTWPFGGSGGGSWGSVSEIPCAMLYVNHRSEGVVKSYLKPQRQQIGWTITGTDLTTAVLIFFNYDAAGENLVSLRLVAFTDQVVEIESMHIHYWEDE